MRLLGVIVISRFIGILQDDKPKKKNYKSYFYTTPEPEIMADAW
jgi:hypothetical protein